MRSSSGFSRRRSFLIVAAAAAFVLVLPADSLGQTLETGPIKVTDSGSITPNGYALKGVTGTANNAGLFGYGNVSSSAINIDGVVGYVQTQQSVGVVGWAQSTGSSAYGVYGYSATGPGVYGVNNNNSISIYGYNGGSGFGVYGYSATGTGTWGESASGSGVVGRTDTTTGTALSGVAGNDNSTKPGNYGVSGISALGSGVAAMNQFGTPGSGVVDALLAETQSGADAIDSFQYGGGIDANYFYADSSDVDGDFEAGTNATEALYTTSDAAAGGVLAAANKDGVAASAYGASGVAALPVIQAIEGLDGTYPFATYNDDNGGVGANGETFIISDTTQGIYGNAYTNGSDVNISGDLYVAGNIMTTCSTSGVFPAVKASNCVTGPYVVKTPSGANVRTYTPSQSLPTVEDFGEGQLVNGQAVVALEKTFSSTIDPKRSYLVFVTPEGDCHGLYIAGKTPSGFLVRELMGGHSTIAFQYRIVAHPYGDTSARMSVITPKALPHHVLALHDVNPHSTFGLAMAARSKALRAAAAHRFVRQQRSPARPPLPLVNPALFKR